MPEIFSSAEKIENKNLDFFWTSKNYFLVGFIWKVIFDFQVN